MDKTEIVGILETLRDANFWMWECPISGRSGDAMFETFGTWVEEVLEHNETVRHAYEAEMETEAADEITEAFWDSVAQRCFVTLSPRKG